MCILFKNHFLEKCLISQKLTLLNNKTLKIPVMEGSSQILNMYFWIFFESLP